MEDKQKQHENEDKPGDIYERCEHCGTIYNKTNRARHLRTKKCRDVVYMWTQRFEITR